MPDAAVVCAGLVDRIGLDGSTIRYETAAHGTSQAQHKEIYIADHAAALQMVVGFLVDPEMGVIKDPNEIDVVGHRVVHGGEAFSNTVVIDAKVKEKIRHLFGLAPLHNPANYQGIEVAEEIFSRAIQVAVFDTAFHQTIPPVAYRMAIPNSLYAEHRIRSYGFHGTSHKYVAGQAVSYLRQRDTRLIVIHLGNGCSMSAIQNGVCVDTSMGFGPMNGLIMGTRTGDLDQSVIFHLVKSLGYSLDDVNTMLNKQSGMLGLTGFSDMRDVKGEYEKGNISAVLAYEMYGYHIRKYIGAYSAVLGGLDAIAFTAGVGENDPLTRSLSLKNLEFLGVHLDPAKNSAGGKGIVEIQTPESPVKVLVVPTNEELEIARQCYQLVTNDDTLFQSL